MPIKTNTGWKCNICGMEHARDIDALSCEQSHEVIYVPIKREDLFRLVQFLYTGDMSLITEELMSTLRKYSTQVKGRDYEIS